MLETTFEQILTQLSKPAVRALTNEKIDSVDELYARGRKALLSLHGFGPKSIRTIEEMTGKRIEVKKGSPFRGDPFFIYVFVFQHYDLYCRLLLVGSFFALLCLFLLVSHP